MPQLEAMTDTLPYTCLFNKVQGYADDSGSGKAGKEIEQE